MAKDWKEQAATRVISAVCHQFSLLVPPATKLSAETRNWLIEEGAAVIREEKEKP
jgi:predicted deacetylase